MFNPRLTQDGALESLGLGGDGDEIDAIHDVERCFSVVLDYRDAEAWHRVGDVYTALVSALSPAQREDPELWTRFSRALSDVSGADPTRVRPETLLLSPSRHSWIPALIIAAVAGMMAAIWH